MKLSTFLRRCSIAVVAGMTLLTACTAGPITSGVEDLEGAPAPAQTPSVAASLPSPNSAYDPSNEITVQVVKQVAPAVVNITTNTLQRDSFFGGSQPGRAVGTGFIIRSDGIIVTNFHVVEQAVRVRVTLPPPDGRTFSARQIGGDSAHDLAVLKIEGRNLPTVPLGNSDQLALGERVIALGYALALPGGPTVTQGIISSLARTVQAEDPNGNNGAGATRTYEDVLQTDAAINPGNSGGPLVDLAGNVVGINTAGAGGAENVGFSIAINAARAVIERALEHPDAPTPYLGVSTTTVGPGLASQYGLPVDHGALVVQIVQGGPAAKAGIREGDIVLEFEGTAVNGSDDLGAAILERQPGDTVSIRVVHESGESETFRATLTERPVNP
ncbi:MAG: S1C family serine protease [Actinomycetota bacterium]